MTEEFKDEMQVEAQFTMPFVMVYNHVADSMAFAQPIDKLTYINLLRFAFNKGEATPSIPRLALMGSVSLNTVRASIKRLQEMKLVIKEERKLEDGTNKSNKYLIYDLSQAMKENSVSNPEKYLEAKQVFKKKTKPKKDTPQNLKGTKKEESGVETHPSKFEEGGKIVEEGAQINEGVPQKFEPEEESINQTSLNTSLNTSKINQSIKEETKDDGLTDDIEEVYALVEKDMPRSTYNIVVARVKEYNPARKNFKKYLLESVKTELVAIKKNAEDQSNNTANQSDYYNLVTGKETAATVEVPTTTEIDEEKNKKWLEDLLAGKLAN